MRLWWLVRCLLATWCLSLLPLSPASLPPAPLLSRNGSSPSGGGNIRTVNAGWRNTSVVGGDDAADASGGALIGAFDSLWRKVRPFLLEDGLKRTDRLVAFRERLLTRAEDLINARTRGTKVLQREKRLVDSVNSIGTQQRHRTKRNHPIDLPLYKDHDGVLVVEGLRDATRLPVDGSRDIDMALWRGRLIVTIIDIDLNLSLYSLDQRSLKATVVWTSPGFFKCRMARVSLESLLLICIPRDSPYEAGSFIPRPARGSAEATVFLLREAAPGNPNIIVSILQSIPTHSPSDVHIWLQEERWYLMVADAMVKRAADEGPEADGPSTYHTTSSIYHWTGQYFDLVHELPGTHPTSVLHFRAQTYNFIAMANFINNKGEHNCHSYIYRYSLNLQRYVHFQQLLTKGARHFEAFTLGSGAFPHIHLAVANSCEDYEDSSMGRCNPYTNSKIYRFHFGKFVLFQEIPTAYAVQWLAIQVEDGVVLAVANTLTGVTFYQYNGWRFVPSAFQPNSGPFSAGVTAMAARSWNGSVVIGVTNQNSNYSSPLVSTLYSLTLSRDASLQEFHEESEAWCKERLNQLRRQDLAVLLQQLRDAPKVTSQNFTFTMPVTIVGNLSVKLKSSATQVYVRGQDAWIPDQVNALVPRRVLLQQELQRAKLRLQATIPLQGPVTWPANLHLANFDARGTSNTSSVVDLLVTEVNNQVMVNKRKLLKISGSTVLQLQKIHFHHVAIQGKAVVTKLLNRPMAEYVTLGGGHTISGEVTFLGGVSASLVTLRGTVDAVSVSNDVLLLTTGPQSHAGKVSCENLEVGALDVNTINNVNINQLFQSLVTRDAPAAAVTGQLVVNGDLHSGNLEVNVTNVDLYNPLRTDDSRPQVVSGDHRVGGMRCLSARVTGRVNGVRVPGEVFQRHYHLSYSVSSAAFTHLLAASLTINTALHTITASNGHLDVMLVTGSQPVTAQKTFVSMHLKNDPSSSTYGRRRRRELDSDREACVSLDDQTLSEGEARREGLLRTLRRVAAAQDLLHYLNEDHPGGISLPHHGITFYARLSQDVRCAFSEVDGEGSVLTFDLRNLDWKNEGKRMDLRINDAIKGLVVNLEKYKKDLDEDIANRELTWHDVFVIFVSARMAMYVKGEDDLPVLESVILAISNERSNDGQTEHECKVCPDMKTNSTVMDNECLRGFVHIKNVLRRVREYASIARNLTQLSEKQREVLQVALEEQGIGVLLQVIREQQQLSDALRVAGECLTQAVTGEGDEIVMKMLSSYRRELLEAEKTTARRTKRSAKATLEYSWTTSEYNCSNIPGHYYENVTYAQGAIVILQSALQYLHNISATLPWNIEISSNSQEGEFESYFRRHTGQVYNTVKMLNTDPIQAVESLDAGSLSKQAMFFNHFLEFAKRFSPMLSLAARDDLESLRALLPASTVKVTQVVTCFELMQRAMNSFPHVGETLGSPISSVDARRYTTLPTTPSFLTISVHRSTPEVPSSTQTTGAPSTGVTLTIPPSGAPGSWVNGRVAGYDIGRLISYFSSHFLASDDPVQYIVTHMDKVRKLLMKSLNVALVNQVDMIRVARHGLMLDANAIDFSITFSELVTVIGEVVVTGLLNKVEASHYVTLKGRHVFTQPLVFTSDVLVNGKMRLESMVNNIDLTTFARNVALTTNSSVVKTFLNPITFTNVAASRLECSECILTGVRLADLVLLNDTAMISGRKSFLEVVVAGGVKMARLQVDFINRINVTALFLSSLRRNPGGVQVMTSAVRLKTLLVPGELATRGFTSSNKIFDMSSLPRRVVYLDQTTTITGGLVIEGATSITTLVFLDTFDTVPSARYTGDWLLKSSDQVIPGAMVVVDSMTCGIVETSLGVLVQGVDVSRLHTACLLVTESTVMTVPVTFGEVRSLLWTSLSGCIQGWDLSQDSILYTTSNVVFNSSMTFLGPVNITGNFVALKGINGVDLDSLCGHLTIHNLNIYGTLRFAKSASADLAQLGLHMISGEAVGDFWMKDLDVSLPVGLLVRVLEARNVNLLTLNGMDLGDLASRVLRRSCNRSQVVSGAFNLVDLTINSLFVDTIKTHSLNSRPASDLLGVFTIAGDQIITGYWKLRSVHIAGNVVTSGLVNGLSMRRLCQLGKPCVVFARKIFTRDLVVAGNHNVVPRRKVQGVDVSESFSSVVYRDACGHVPGLTTFTASLTATSRDVKVHGVVNGVEVSLLQLLTLSGTQVMTGNLSVFLKEGMIFLSSSLSATDGLFNGLDLTALLERAFQVNGANRVRQPVTFHVAVVFQDVSYGPGAIALADVVDGALSNMEYKQSNFHVQELSNAVSWAIKGRVREFWGWRLVQQFEAAPQRLVPLRLVWGKAAGALASGYLALVTRSGGVRLLGYNTASKQYLDFDVIPGNCTRSVVGYRRPDASIFVVTGHACNFEDASHANTSTSHQMAGDEWVKVYRLSVTERPYLVSFIPTPGAADLQVLWWGGVPCLVVVEARGADTVILCEYTAGHFRERQRLHSINPRKVSVAEHEDPLGRSWTFLTVADPGTFPDHRGAAYIWRSDHNNSSFSILQEFDLHSAVWVEFASHRSDLFLAVVLETFRGDQEGAVNIYRMDWFSEDGLTALGHSGTVLHHFFSSSDRYHYQPRPNFHLVQVLSVVQPLEARFLAIPSRLLLYVINQQGFVTRFSQRGIHMFWEEGSLHAAWKTTLEAWSTYDNGTVVHRISVAGQTCALEDAPEEEPATILEEIFRSKEY
ncbi:uncharacterized protein [Procambarus clarkii]